MKGDNLVDISKVADAAGKKGKVDGGIVKASASKGDEFAEFSFKEGSTATLKIADIFVQEKGKEALNKAGDAADGAKVKGGARGKAKAASKAAKGKKLSAKKADSAAAADVRKSVDKIVKYTPSKGSRKETPQKTQAASASVGKSSAKKGGKKGVPQAPSPSGKKSAHTTDKMTMAQFVKYLDWHEKKKGGKASSGGKVLGKRSAGKASATSGKSKASKKTAPKK